MNLLVLLFISFGIVTIDTQDIVFPDDDNEFQMHNPIVQDSQNENSLKVEVKQRVSEYSPIEQIMHEKDFEKSNEFLSANDDSFKLEGKQRVSEYSPTKKIMPQNDFQKSNEFLSTNLYKEMMKKGKANFLISPYSLQILLALIHAGAKEKTSKEIADALNLFDNTTQIQELITALSFDIDQPYTLKSANKIYLAHRFTINKNFKKIAQEVFKSDIESIDLSEGQEASSRINQWVEQKTNYTIKNLINPQLLNADTVSVMINALYFNADWLNMFDSVYMVPGGFHINKTTKVNIQAMKTNFSPRRYINKELDATFLELPYKGEDVAMTIALPNQIDGLSKLEQNIEKVLEQQPLEEIFYSLTISMPKFKMETSIKLKKIMRGLGIKHAFRRTANFSGMTVDENNNIFISHAIQKTFIKVTERGTSAGAATSFGLSDRSIGEYFLVNHPFIYILRHRTNGILFVGKFSNPQGTEISDID